jgi:hypothetical protein
MKGMAFVILPFGRSCRYLDLEIAKPVDCSFDEDFEVNLHFIHQASYEMMRIYLSTQADFVDIEAFRMHD